MSEGMIISGLVILVIGCNLFWAIVTHKLINKIMSRDFFVYQQARSVPKEQDTKLADALKDIKLPAHSGPNELDSLDEMIKKVMPLG